MQSGTPCSEAAKLVQGIYLTALRILGLSMAGIRTLKSLFEGPRIPSQASAFEPKTTPACPARSTTPSTDRACGRPTGWSDAFQSAGGGPTQSCTVPELPKLCLRQEVIRNDARDLRGSFGIIGFLLMCPVWGDGSALVLCLGMVFICVFMCLCFT